MAEKQEEPAGFPVMQMTQVAACEPPWLEIARFYEALGVEEVPGPDANPLIECFLNYTQLRGRKAAKSDETRWCSALLCACFEQSRIQSPRHAMARRWLDWGICLKEPRIGAVCVLWSGKQSGTAGHVGLVVDWTDTHVTLLGGNQSDSVCEATYELDRVLGFRWPQGRSL